MQARGFLNYR